MKHFRWGVERVKRFVNVHLHCIVSNLKTTSKISTLPPWKNFPGRPCCHCKIFNSIDRNLAADLGFSRKILSLIAISRCVGKCRFSPLQTPMIINYTSSSKFSSAAQTLIVEYKVIIILLNTLKLLMNFSLEKHRFNVLFHD